jgi:hypothetical protein
VRNGSRSVELAPRGALARRHTLPILAAVIWGLEEWLRGQFPPTVTIDDVSLVVMMAAAAAALVYLICRAIGWMAAALVNRAA